MSHNEHDHQRCLEMFTKLSEYIDGELDRATCAEIEKHAHDCVACLACMETMKKTVALCKSVKDKPVPHEFSKKLHAIIESMPHRPLP